jgi:hypothetical protein
LRGGHPGAGGWRSATLGDHKWHRRISTFVAAAGDGFDLGLKRLDLFLDGDDLIELGCRYV